MPRPDAVLPEEKEQRHLGVNLLVHKDELECSRIRTPLLSYYMCRAERRDGGRIQS
jgi:hypothetical protein